MKRVTLLMKTGVAISASLLLMTSMPVTAFAEEGAPAESGIAVAEEAAATTEIAQTAENDNIGYNVAHGWLVANQYEGLNVFSVGENGEHLRTTFSNSCYDTFVNDSSTPINQEGDFAYGTPYTRDGISTTIIPELGEDSVTFTYQLQNTSDQEQNFTVGSAADVMINRNDHATIQGDANGFTMTDGERAMEVASINQPFDNLWYGRYTQVRSHFNDNAILTDTVENVDSGVVWGWNVNLLPGQSTSRSAGFRVGAHDAVVTRTIPGFAAPAPAEEAPAPVEETPAPVVVEETPVVVEEVPVVEVPEAVEEYYEQKPHVEPEKDPKVWVAVTPKGQQLPVQNIGLAEVDTTTLYVDITGTSTVDYKDVVKNTYAKAPANGAFVLATSRVSVVDQELLDTLASRKDVTVEVVFPYNGQVLMVKIPAGSDYSSVLDETGFAGFLKLGKVFGTTVLQ